VKLVVLLLCVGACAAHEPGLVAAGDLEIRNAFAFSPPTASEAAGYFTVTNRGTLPDTLVSVTSPIAASAMLHGQVTDGGMVRMQHVGQAVVPARDSLVLAPGGTHLMLVDLSRLPRPGDSITVTLTFSRAGDADVVMPVRAYGDLQ
jgi:copper(I)-binding protein